MADSFQLTLLLPNQVLLSTQVAKVGAEARNGSFVVLPRHIDFVTALVPGILYYLDDAEQSSYAAIDRGILVKRDKTVWVSVLRAILGDDLEHLDQVVEQEFRQLSEQQKQTKTALTRLELSFMRGLMDVGKARRGG